MSAMLFDLRHALRTLLKAPVFTTVTIVTLALGIGANSAMFSLVNAALLRPLGYVDSERLVLMYEGIPQAGLPKLPGSAPDTVPDLPPSPTMLTYRSSKIDGCSRSASCRLVPSLTLSRIWVSA